MGHAMQKLCKMVEEKIEELTRNGMNDTATLEKVYKLTDIYKDIKNTEYWDTKSEYYMSEMDGEDSGYSQRGRKRDSRGRYSRAEGGSSYADGNSYDGEGGGGYSGRRRGRGYSREGGYSGDDGYDRYMESKRSYRSSGGSGDCKQRLTETLEDYMESFNEKMEEMLRDSDCAEERETIRRYMKKLGNL